MASAEDYAKWIIANPQKRGSEEFHTVARAYQQAKSEETYKPTAADIPGPDGMPTPERAPQKEPDSIARQLGLTVRSGIEGVGGLVGTLAEPLRLPMSKAATAMGGNRIPDAGQMATQFSNAIGLPTPQNPTERIAGDVVRTMAGGGAMIKGAQIASQLPGLVGTSAAQLAARPELQLASAAGAGGAGGYSRETGGNEAAQFIAALAGGVAAPVALSGAQRAISAAQGAYKNMTAPSNVNVDIKIENALRGSGMTLKDIPNDIRLQIRNDVADALKISDNLDGAALRRLIDYRATGAIPTKAGLTLDPIDVTQQKNLAKLGANSKDAAAQTLAMAENTNAKTLGSGVSELAGNVGNDAYGNSARAMGALSDIDTARKTATDALYAKARDSLGRAAPLDHVAFSKAANLALDEAMAGGSLPSKARDILNKITTGEIPFNVNTAEQIKTQLGKMAQGASIPGDERHAIGLVRRALDNAPLTETHGLGPDALAAFKQARASHAQRMGAQEATPALKAVADGMEPDKFFQKFILGGDVKDLRNLKNELANAPEAMSGLRGQLIAELKTRGNVDPQAGTFNQSSFNRALDGIGDRKLSLFFTPDEVMKLRAIGRVAGYEQVQPRGSAVNNSNTASSAIAMILDKIAGSPLLSKVPFGKVLAEPAQNISVGIKSKQAMDSAKTLALPAPKEDAARNVPLPALLAAPEERKKRGLYPE